jgi:hypothetical protein
MQLGMIGLGRMGGSRERHGTGALCSCSVDRSDGRPRLRAAFTER